MVVPEKSRIPLICISSQKSIKSVKADRIRYLILITQLMRLSSELVWKNRYEYVYSYYTLLKIILCAKIYFYVIWL